MNSVALILNLNTGHVSPQYHVIYDDNFTTVDSLRLGTVPTKWPGLCSNSWDLVTDEAFTLASEWTTHSQTQSTIHWLDSHLDDTPTTEATLFPSDAISSNEGVAANFSQIVQESKGGTSNVSQLIGENEGDQTDITLDPFSGKVSSPPDSFDPSPQHSQHVRNPPKHLIEDPLFGCAALQHGHFQRFNLCVKASSERRTYWD